MGISEAQSTAPPLLPGAPSPHGVEARAERLPAAAGPLALAAAFCALAAWSWGKWTDVHIDFGNELYIPWQITEGKALYRDMAHRNGPLPHYLNAAWFTLFGVSLRTLVWCNLAILAGIVAMVWRVFTGSCGRVTATAACGLLLGIFAFSQYTTIANYNYVTPYHHHQTHGIALSLGMMLALGQALRSKPALWVAVAGVAFGAVFLTKAELFAPAVMAAGAGLMGVLGVASSRAALALAFGAGAALPVAVAFAALAAQMPAAVALEGVVGNWAHLGGGLLSDPFYARGAGLDAPLPHLGRMGLACLNLAGFFAVAAVADHALPTVARRPWVSAAAGILVFAACFRWMSKAGWGDAALTLPLIAVLSAGLLVSLCWRRRSDRAFLVRWGPLAMWSLWALGLLAKTGLTPRFQQYGFALSMPATLLLGAWVVHGLPQLAARRWGGGGIARALGLATLLAATAHFWSVSDRAYALKEQRVGSGPDAIWTVKPPFHLRGARVARALVFLGDAMGPDDTLLVLPEGISLNYWLRKENPTRFHLFLPTELEAFGRDVVLADLQAHAPDWVAFVHRASGEFGVGPFGEDPANGKAIAAWVRDHYERVDGIGAPPFTGQRFGIEFWRRADSSPPSPR